MFRPLLKKIIWGGSRICEYKDINPKEEGIGESWEISHVPGNISIIANHPFEGKTLEEIIQACGADLLGQSVMEKHADSFPLLIKFIDASDDLSIQVHPDDTLAKERHNSPGKTEMWYVVDASPDASIYCGFNKPVTPEEYIRRVEDNTLAEILRQYRVEPGDVFYLPAGRVHAICKGCFIAEIQQTSDITYRIYDYNRKDANGNTRELHTDLAKDAIDFTYYEDCQTHYSTVDNQSVPIVRSPFFNTNILQIDRNIRRDISNLDSFLILIPVQGAFTLRDDQENTIHARQGNTILIPAKTKYMEIQPENGKVKIIETYLGGM